MASRYGSFYSWINVCVAVWQIKPYERSLMCTVPEHLADEQLMIDYVLCEFMVTLLTLQ